MGVLQLNFDKAGIVDVGIVCTLGLGEKSKVKIKTRPVGIG